MTKPTQDELREAAQTFKPSNSFDRGAEHVDLSGPTTAISIRLPDRMIEILKAIASRRGLGYQTLMKQWLDERLRQEASGQEAEDMLRDELQNLTQVIIRETISGLEGRLGGLDRRLASVEEMEARILDRVGAKPNQ